MMEEARIKELEKRPFVAIFPDSIQNIRDNVCPHCKNSIEKFRNAISEREYRISGMCQTCQDDVFGMD